jgi:DNA-binding transcriptional regulator YiaG
MSKPSPVRLRILRIALKHYGEEGLTKRLKVSDETVVSWMEEQADIPSSKLLALIDMIDEKGAMGEDL